MKPSQNFSFKNFGLCKIWSEYREHTKISNENHKAYKRQVEYKK